MFAELPLFFYLLNIILEHVFDARRCDNVATFIKDEQQSQEDLVTLTKVLLGLSSLSTAHPVTGSAWRLIQGFDADHKSLSAGWTKSDKEMTLDDLTFINILNQPHNYNKLVYYNVGQQHILANKLSMVVLKEDFGSGNKKFTYHP